MMTEKKIAEKILEIWERVAEKMTIVLRCWKREREREKKKKKKEGWDMTVRCAEKRGSIDNGLMSCEF